MGITQEDATMLTLETLQKRVDSLNSQVENSQKQITEGRAQIEQMQASHNALLGMQYLAKQLVEEASKPVEPAKDESVTNEQQEEHE